MRSPTPDDDELDITRYDVVAQCGGGGNPIFHLIYPIFHLIMMNSLVSCAFSVCEDFFDLFWFRLSFYQP
jgi:hypothetical protein